MTLLNILAYLMLATIWALTGINSRLSRNLKPHILNWILNGLLWPITVPIFCVLFVYFTIKHFRGLN